MKFEFFGANINEELLVHLTSLFSFVLTCPENRFKNSPEAFIIILVLYKTHSSRTHTRVFYEKMGWRNLFVCVSLHEKMILSSSTGYFLWSLCFKFCFLRIFMAQ